MGEEDGDDEMEGSYGDGALIYAEERSRPQTLTQVTSFQGQRLCDARLERAFPS